jgi:hypothetical protein
MSIRSYLVSNLTRAEVTTNEIMTVLVTAVSVASTLIDICAVVLVGSQFESIETCAVIATKSIDTYLSTTR